MKNTAISRAIPPRKARESATLTQTVYFTPESLDQLTDVIDEKMDQAVERIMAAPRARTVSRADLARVIGCSTCTVDTLRREGMPEFRLVDSPRFDVEDVLAWLKTRDQKGDK